MEKSEEINLLKQCHSFPGPYVFKVIGDNTPRFAEAVLSEVSKELGEGIHQGTDFRTRESSGGKYLSITLKLEVESAEQVLRFYERFSKLTGLRSLM
jgi:putative lipoic acid-binding regulatory protein